MRVSQSDVALACGIVEQLEMKIDGTLCHSRDYVEATHVRVCYLLMPPDAPGDSIGMCTSHDACAVAADRPLVFFYVVLIIAFWAGWLFRPDFADDVPPIGDEKDKVILQDVPDKRGADASEEVYFRSCACDDREVLAESGGCCSRQITVNESNFFG